MNIPYLRVAGSFGKMGRLHGYVFGDKIEALYKERLSMAREQVSGGDIRIIRKVAINLWNAIVKYNQEIAEEVYETSVACKLEPWQLVVAGGISDIMDVLRSGACNSMHECTVAINAVNSLIAGTWDSHTTAGEAMIVLERHPNKGPSTLALTTAGWPCQQGVNSDGLGFAITNLTPRRSHSNGLIYIAAIAALSSMRSVKEVLNAFRILSFSSGHSYLIVDTSGAAAIVETTSECVIAREITGTAVKANHYQEGVDQIDDNGLYDSLDGSLARQEELTNCIADANSPIEYALALGRCKLVNRRQGPIATQAHFVINAVERQVQYGLGPACMNNNLGCRESRILGGKYI